MVFIARDRFFYKNYSRIVYRFCGIICIYEMNTKISIGNRWIPFESIGKEVIMMKKTKLQIRKVGATGRDQKTAFFNETASDADIRWMIDRFRAGEWPFLLLETEQCRIDICTLYVPEGKCSVTIILNLHGQWKALTRAFPLELGVSMFLDCYKQGCLYENFDGWYDATVNFQNSIQDVQKSVEEASSAVCPGSQTDQKTADIKKTNPLYVLAWYAPPILLIPALFAFLVHVDVSERVLDLLILLLVVLIVGVPLCVPILMKKRMEKRAAVLERDFPNINYKFTAHNCVFYLDTEGGHIGVVWKNNPSQLQIIDPAKVTDIRTNSGQQLRGTSLVSCQFRLDGKKVKIYTLRVSGGQLAMKHPRVIEAIAKADQLGEALRVVLAQRAIGGV